MGYERRDRGYDFKGPIPLIGTSYALNALLFIGYFYVACFVSSSLDLPEFCTDVLHPLAFPMCIATTSRIIRYQAIQFSTKAILTMEAMLKQELGTSILKSFGGGGGGCISEGQGYVTDQGKIFVKMNHKEGARRMFDGEAASLEEILKTGVIKAPRPIQVLDNPRGGAVFVMEHLEMKGLARRAGELGTNLARMHLANEECGKRMKSQESSVHKKDGDTYVHQFGFKTATCCGYIPQDNTWTDDWVSFFCQCKLQCQLDLIEKEYSDREARDLWHQLQPKVPSLFKGIEIKPALLHGDLWGGNVAETTAEPVIFDPASFYGHHEFELGIASMFGGFNRSFYDAYHKLIPKQPGFEERQELYKLFHYLNHWNHFGSGYRSQSISIMRRLVRG